MQAIQSEYRDDVVFIGHNNERISDETVCHFITRDTGRDFDGIEWRETMDASHTNTARDLESFSKLFDNYLHVEMVTLRPIR